MTRIQRQKGLRLFCAQAEILCRLAGDGVPERVRIWLGFHPTGVVTQERVGAIREFLGIIADSCKAMERM